MKKWSLIIFLLLPLVMHAQIITTFAGNGTPGYSGDAGPATAAAIALPAAGNFDSHGNYYFVGGISSHRVRMVDNSGIIHTVAGISSGGFSGDNGLATAAQLKQPYGAAVDNAGNIFIADYGNYRIRRVDGSTHIITTIAGNGISTSTGDGGPATAATVVPYGICLDKFGNLYFIDGYGSKIRKIAPTGIITTVAGTGTIGFSGDGNPATAADISVSYGVCTDSLGNLYIACNTRIRKVNISTGIINTMAGNSAPGYIGDGMPATSAQFNAFNIGIDTARNKLYIADDGNDRIYQIDASGIFHLIAGTGVGGYNGDGIIATTAQVFNPEGIAVDACGNLYIADDANYRVRKVTFNPTGTPTITISPNPSDTVCYSTPVTYTATVAGGGAPGYKWYVNGAVVSTAGSTYTYTPTNGDSVRCVYTGTDVCSGNPVTVSSNSIHMVINTVTEALILLSGVNSAPVGAMVTVTATVTAASSSYTIKWYKNSVLFSTTSSPVVTTTYTKAAGTDNITARVIPAVIRTPPVCYDSSELSAVHTVSVVATGVSFAGPTMTNVVTWPNPVGDELHIDNVATMASYRLLNMTGAVILHGTLRQGNNSVSIRSLPAGMYMVEVAGGEEGRVVRKIVKK